MTAVHDPYDLSMSGGAGARRPVLVAVDGKQTVRVTLRHRERLYVGEATHDTPATAAATATLDALGRLLPAAASLDLDWCGVVQPGVGPNVVLVMVTITVAGVPMRQSGTAIIVGGDALTAAAKAAFDALNRRLEIMGI